ncbi:MAG: cupin domain-containing protein [Pseudomonadales bacterium]|nr:cupin domain-containing protein [Pseudomonadales bacterium]
MSRYTTLGAVLLPLLLIASQGHSAEVSELFVKELSTILQNQEVQVLSVTYAPGEAGIPHRHPGHSFIYVTKGSIKMGVRGAEPVTLSEGETFYESPDDVHTVGQNLSETEPAQLLVFMLKPQGTPIVLPE